MYFSSAAIKTVLLLAATSLPAVHGAIAIGQQTREGSTNYAVAWVEGLNPCQFDVGIAPLSQRLCNQNFRLDGTDYYLVGCDKNNKNPQRLRRVKDNSLYGTCTTVADKKIGCSGDPHDVIKHYLCG